jgi:hypothetical protein
VDWVEFAWDKVQWREFVKMMIYLIPENGSFDQLSDYQLLDGSAPYS